MVKLKQILAVAAVGWLLCLAGCGVGDAGKGSAKQAETMDMLTFTAQMDGGSSEITYWGDGVSTYYFFLPSGCTPAQLAVTTQNGITLRKDGEAESARVSFANGETFEGIECNTTYLLGCRDQNDYIYELPVVFMQGENIHSVFITTQSGSIEAVLADKSVKEKGDILIAGPDGRVVYNGGLTHIKGRGNGSWFSHKKPFNLKLSEKAELLGKGASREWCLINQEFDLSCLRNKIAYDLAANAGIAYSPDCAFADVWIDGQYFGLYLLTDRIGISEASVDITDLEKATEAVNLEELKTYPAGSVTAGSGNQANDLHYVEIPNDPEDITGGYLLEVDKFYAQDKAARFNTERIFSVTLKAPEYASKAQVEYIHDYISKMETAISTPGSLAYQDYIDLASWVHMCVLEEILADSDYMGSSQYFYKEADPEGGRAPLYAGPVWDKDLSLGNSNSSSCILPNVLLSPSRSWIKDLYSRPEFYEQMVAAYCDVFRPLAAELLEEGVDAYAAQTEASAKMNYTRWASAFAEQPASFREDDVEEIKDFISARIALLDDLWLNGAVYHSAKVTTNKSVAQYEDMYYTLDYMVPDGEALGDLRTPPLEGYKFVGWFYGTPSNPGAPYDPAAPLTGDIRIFAKWEKTAS